MALVEPRGVSADEVAHAGWQIGVWRLERQVEAVAHQAVAVPVPPTLEGDRHEDLQEPVSALVVDEHVATVVAARHDVVAQAATQPRGPPAHRHVPSPPTPFNGTAFAARKPPPQTSNPYRTTSARSSHALIPGARHPEVNVSSPLQLIWSEANDRANCHERGEQFVPAAEGYPDCYRIGLDVQTGVVVSIRSVGRVTHSPAFEVTIHEVDGPVDMIEQVRKRGLERSLRRRGERPSGWGPY